MIEFLFLPLTSVEFSSNIVLIARVRYKVDVTLVKIAKQPTRSPIAHPIEETPRPRKSSLYRSRTP